jgi:uncharacterized tellurite resistance protein B-like protein
VGFLDSIKSSISPQFSEQKAVMTIVVAAINADGNVSEEEVGRLRSMCARSPIFAANSKAEDDSLIDFAVNICLQLGRDAVAKAATALTPDLRETAFAFAAEMILADGLLGAAEEAFLAQLVKTLSLSERTAESIVVTTLIRGRGIA